MKEGRKKFYKRHKDLISRAQQEQGKLWGEANSIRVIEDISAAEIWSEVLIRFFEQEGYEVVKTDHNLIKHK